METGPIKVMASSNQDIFRTPTATCLLTINWTASAHYRVSAGLR